MPENSNELSDPGAIVPKESNTDIVPVENNTPLNEVLSEKLLANLTVKQRNALQKYANNMKFGFTTNATPMICLDDKCPFTRKCPLFLNNIPRPFREECPVEKMQIASWMHTFAEAAGVDPTDPSAAYDMMIVDQIVFQMVLESRSAWQLALDPQIEREYISGFNPLGQPFYNREVAKAAEFYEKLIKTKMRLLKELLATRKAKSEAEAKGYADPSRVAANMMARAKKMRTITQDVAGNTEAMEIELEDPKHDDSTPPEIPKVPGEKTIDADFDA